MSSLRRPEAVSNRPLVEKLGIRPGARVAIVGLPDEALRSMLRQRGADFVEGDPPSGTELIFLAADVHEQLKRLAALRQRLKPDGAIWVVSRKGKAATLRDIDVIAAAVANGLVDNKVVSFSPTHTALRLVIPRARRAEHAAATAGAQPD